ncbi:MAG: MFS transporter [Actinobacteria bacterium]|nr:MFS transporter [Actinomycetota bacterium]
MSVSGLLGPLHHRDYRLLACAAVVSLLGDGFFYVAIAIQVYSIANAPVAMSAVGVVWTLSTVVFVPLGGVASDRWERRRIMVVADLVRAVSIGTLGLLSISGAAQLWHLLVIGACFAVGNALFNPTATAIVPDLVPADRLAQANALLGAARPAMLRLAGPALGGLTIAWAGPGAAFLVDALTFVVSAALLAGIRRRPPAHPGTRTAADAVLPPLRELVEGLRFVRARPWCWAWLTCVAVSMLAYYGPVEVLLPYVLLNDFSYGSGEAGRALGLILGAGGLGSVAASILVGRFDLPRRFMTALYAGEAVAIVAVGAYGLMTALWHGVLAGFVVGGLMTFTDVVWTTVLQRLVPRHLLGRVSGVDWFASLGLLPLSFALAGPLAQLFGARPTLVVGALAGASAPVLLAVLVRGARAPERAAEGLAPVGVPAAPAVGALADPFDDHGHGGTPAPASGGRQSGLAPAARTGGRRGGSRLR